MQQPTHLDFGRIAQDLQIRKVQVEAVVQLLEEGNTVPFIARFRVEKTGGLSEELLRKIHSRLLQHRQLNDRKQTILKSIEGQGKLTDELKTAILEADHPRRLDDLYLPYKPKKKTPAAAAREKGLEPAALAIWGRDPAAANLDELLPTLVNPEKELPTVEEVKQGIGQILAELVAETAEVRGTVRLIVRDTGKLSTTKSENLPEGKGLEYKDYFTFTEAVRQIPPHRILAINRGEKEGSLKVKLEWDVELVRLVVLEGREGRPPLLPLADHPHKDFLRAAAEDALGRVLVPSLEREIRKELTESAQDHAVAVFARNLRSLLMQPPLRGRRVLAIDPGFRPGCKVAALDEAGNLLEHATLFPHAPQNKRDEARHRLATLISRQQVVVVAIGSGTACRETEEFVAELIAQWPTEPFTPPPPPEKKPPAPPPPPMPEVVMTTPPPLPDAAAPAAEAPPAEAAAAPPAVATPAAEAPPVEAAAALPEPAVFVVEPASPPPAVAVEPPPAAAEPVAAAPPPPPPEPLPPPGPMPADLAYVIVNEAGASVYSTSPIGREEFPDLDASLRSAISIGRRLQDPLSELVKIDPQNIGVGLYQHDVNPRHLKESLEAIVESCVNHVGVDLNTAGVSLLRHISGLNPLAAREIVEHRKQHGPFKNREQLAQLPGVGPARAFQAVGFLKVSGSDQPLDLTWIHPETYPAVQQLLTDLGSSPDVVIDPGKLGELREKFNTVQVPETAAKLGIGPGALTDIMDELAQPGRDPRDELPPPIFRKGILRLEDMQPGMELKGTVLNVVDFGAFVDIGLKDSGLVHISQMANRYIKNPYDVVAVGDVVNVWVLTVDQERRRVSLSMIQPGTERKAAEKREPRPPRGERPPRGDRPPRVDRPPHPQQGDRPPQVAAPGGPPQGDRPPRGDRPPPRGDRPFRGPPRGDRPPPRHGRPAHAQQHQGDSQAQRSGPPPRPPQRRPSTKIPKPKLSQAALEGAAPLRSLSELAAYFEAKQQPPKPPPPPPAPEPPKAQEAAAPPPAPPAPPATDHAPEPAPPTDRIEAAVAPEPASVPPAEG